MHITIRTIGNSKGVVLPKPLLAQAGLDDQSIADLSFENGAIVLRKPATSVRVGWAEAAQALAAQGNEALLLDEFGNAGDAELVWRENWGQTHYCPEMRLHLACKPLI